MAKEPKTPKQEPQTPFQRFERLTKRLVAVPKERVRNERKGSQRKPK